MRIYDSAVGFVFEYKVGEIVYVVLPCPPILYYFVTLCHFFMLFALIFILLSPGIGKSVSPYRTVLSHLAF